LSLLAHELAHGFTATWLGLPPRQFAAVAYLALMPIFFLRIPGIYTLSPGQRIQVWISGVWINLTIASTALIVTQTTTMPVLYKQVLTGLAVSNGLIVAWNLIPFLPTDGYFIMCTLLKKPNVRPRAWQEFSRWIRLRVKPSPMLLLYFGLSLLTTLGALLLNVTWAYRIATRSVVGFAVGCLLTLPIVLGLAHLIKSLMATRKPEGEGV
jgi:putative peptide zinc metalloprotease protein